MEPDNMAERERIREQAVAAGQRQVLRFEAELDEAGERKLFGQLAAVDFSGLGRLIRDYVLTRPQTGIPADLAPAPYFPRQPRTPEEADLYRRAAARGAEMLAAGRVAALTVAGGQGTRLGFDGPKGTFPVGPVSGRTLFGYFADALKRTGEKFGRPVGWYIMTSEINHAATTAFFRENDWFGLDPEQVFFFTQGTMPAIGYDGRLLLAARDSLALSPDGHGGTLLALRKSGALDRMKRDGVDTLSYFQVDNPLVPVADPLFLGLHDLERSEMSAIMLAKTGPFEKLGNFCVSGGRLRIIEYSDLPSELAESRNPDGTLRFIAGSPAIHVISRAFIDRLTAGGALRLPWHRADKKVACLDDAGRPVAPTEPNAVKLESFIFDALPLAGRTMVLEGDRASVFAPVKNKTGVDSAESSRAMLLERDARRLEAAGVDVPRDAAGKLLAEIEISPRIAVDEADVKAYVAAHGLRQVAAGARLVLE